MRLVGYPLNWRKGSRHSSCLTKPYGILKAPGDTAVGTLGICNGVHQRGAGIWRREKPIGYDKVFLGLDWRPYNTSPGEPRTWLRATWWRFHFLGKVQITQHFWYILFLEFSLWDCVSDWIIQLFHKFCFMVNLIIPGCLTHSEWHSIMLAASVPGRYPLAKTPTLAQGQQCQPCCLITIPWEDSRTRQSSTYRYSEWNDHKNLETLDRIQKK